jgi:hypothetical protein
MEMLFQVPGMAFFDCDGVRIMLAQPEGGFDDRSGSIIYFSVADIHAAVGALRANGVWYPLRIPPGSPRCRIMI